MQLIASHSQPWPAPAPFRPDSLRGAAWARGSRPHNHGLSPSARTTAHRISHRTRWRHFASKVPVRKTFKLQVEGKHPDRVLDAIKHEVRKYVKRQRRVPLPVGVDFWDFSCKFGSAEETAEAVHLAEIVKRMDAAAAEGAAQCFVELVAIEGHRRARPAGAPSLDETTDFDDED